MRWQGNVSKYMKQFAFPLERAMDWRQTQVRIGEAELARLQAELHGIEASLLEIRVAKERAERGVAVLPALVGSDLMRLDAFMKASENNLRKLRRLAEEARKRVAWQLEVVIAKRRDLRLLENLRQRKLIAWKAEFDREIDVEAAELHLINSQRASSQRERPVPR